MSIWMYIEYSAFTEATVPICTFVIQNQNQSSIGQYIRLEEFKGADLQPLKVKEAVKHDVDYRYSFDSKSFMGIPGTSIAYWIDSKMVELLKENKLSKYAEACTGMQTGNNTKYIRNWHEVNIHHTNIFNQSGKWIKYNTGGENRKWYGGYDSVVNWENDGIAIKQDKSAVVRNEKFYYKRGITWKRIGVSNLGLRFLPEGFIFDQSADSVFPKSQADYNFLLSFFNTKVAKKFLEFLSPTMNLTAGNIKNFPILKDNLNYDTQITINNLSDKSIAIARWDWDSFETSWDFKKHPFLTYRGEAKTLEECYANWADHVEKQFQQLKKNEEELNRIFIELYGLEDELTPEVPDEEVTVRRADRVRDAKSFLSYCIGLMMGRYSLDVEGLAYAGGEWDASKYKTFQPDQDGIIPLTETAYFEDDVITRLQELLILMFGEDTLAENLRWLAESLTMKNNETPTERLRRYFFDEFYADHCKVYQKRPIYWMAESGSKKGFRALFYLHRYTPETLATMRFTYVQNLQEKLRQEQKRLEQDLINPDLSAAMKKRYEKQLNQIKAQQEELVEFDKKLAELANQRIVLDLDDGVVVNYEKLKTILAKIK